MLPVFYFTPRNSGSGRLFADYSNKQTIKPTHEDGVKKLR